MNARPSLTILTLMIGCLFGVPTSSGQSTAEFRGLVVDRSGAIIQNAFVTLFSEERVLTAKADDQGQFVFVELPRSTKVMEISAPGFNKAKLTDSQIFDSVPGRVLITLDVGSGSFTGCDVKAPLAKINGITHVPIGAASPSYESWSDNLNVVGTVRDAWGGPLANATITIVRSEKPYQGFTNEKGEFQFRDHEPGGYTLKAEHEGYYESASTSFWVARQNLTRLSVIFLFPQNGENVCAPTAPDLTTIPSPLPSRLRPPQ